MADRARRDKAPAAKPGNLSSILRTHKVEGQATKQSFPPPTPHGMLTSPVKCTQVNKYNSKCPENSPGPSRLGAAVVSFLLLAVLDMEARDLCLPGNCYNLKPAHSVLDPILPRLTLPATTWENDYSHSHCTEEQTYSVARGHRFVCNRDRICTQKRSL